MTVEVQSVPLCASWRQLVPIRAEMRCGVSYLCITEDMGAVVREKIEILWFGLSL